MFGADLLIGGHPAASRGVGLVVGGVGLLACSALGFCSVRRPTRSPEMAGPDSRSRTSTIGGSADGPPRRFALLNGDVHANLESGVRKTGIPRIKTIWPIRYPEHFGVLAERDPLIGAPSWITRRLKLNLVTLLPGMLPARNEAVGGDDADWSVRGMAANTRK